MEALLIQALNVSISASFLVLAIVLYRLLFKKSPRFVLVLLWGLVGLRLLLPFHIESKFSVIPSENTIPETITQERFPSLDTGFSAVDEIVNPILSGGMEARPENSANPMQIVMTILGWVWLGVMVCMLLYMAISFVYLRIQTRISLQKEGNVFLCDNIPSPFILGILKPRIFLPSDISEEQYALVLLHERAHLKRFDHIWKPLGFLLLSVYWFNPLLWLAYILLCRDIEVACDENVISALNADEKAHYAKTLLALGIRSRVVCACPLAFGEVSVKSRVSAISKYKKPTTAIVALSLLACAVLAVCFLTYKKQNAVAVEEGIWYAGKVIGATDMGASCDAVPRLVFTKGGELLVESKDLSTLSYIRLGKMHSAYISKKQYQELFTHLAFRAGYGADFFHENILAAWRITPSVSAPIDEEEVYLFRGDKTLYLGYVTEGRASALYELYFNETLPAYLYTLTYASTDTQDTSLILYTENGMGRILFGGNLNYQAMGTYRYKNGKLIFHTVDSFDLTLVFQDNGDALIFREEESDLGGFDGLLPEGTTFRGYYQLYGVSSATIFADFIGDTRPEFLFLNVAADGTLQYIIHRTGETLANSTMPFIPYDSVQLKEENGELYLLCEYSEKDFHLYRYRLTFDGTELILSEVQS